MAATLASLQKAFFANKTVPLAWRSAQLQALDRLVAENENQIIAALHSDLKKPKFEAEIKHALANLINWSAPTRVTTPWLQMKGLSSSYIQPLPLGVILIIGVRSSAALCRSLTQPWNFPIMLCLSPLIGAISAGNCAVIKPSEVSPASSKLLAELIPRYLDKECFRVVEGGVEPTTELLSLKFDHIFYTGSTAVGRVVMKAAAENLVPVTLELGGKSPTIVDREVDMDVAVRRILFGKIGNSGQMCVAPDYILVHKDVVEEFTKKLQATIKQFLGEDPSKSVDYGRIINARHFKRIMNLLKDQEVIAGGRFNESELYIEPTLIRCAADSKAPIMQEEIFGPLLPIISVPDINCAVNFIRARPKPLALYIFSRNQTTVQQILAVTSSGGACVNDTVMHLAVPDLPFGGVGDSGMGAYHGKTSFDCFTHRRSVLDKTTWLDSDMRYPPITDKKLNTLRNML